MINFLYYLTLKDIWIKGDYLVSRGEGVKSLFGYDFGRVGENPIINYRKTAWKTALKELEWFMSGDTKCPEGVLKDIWWTGQLNPEGHLKAGYPEQLRRHYNDFHQIAWLQKQLKENPSSRRLCLTVWNPKVMADFTNINENPMAPTACHLCWNQFSVRDKQLHMNAIFRSTDAILGLPHNLVQHRALQLYLAHHVDLEAAPYYNLYLNDVHYYCDHEDHSNFVDALIKYYDKPQVNPCDAKLVYQPSAKEFQAKDFYITSHLPEPIYTGKIRRAL